MVDNSGWIQEIKDLLGNVKIFHISFKSGNLCGVKYKTYISAVFGYIREFIFHFMKEWVSQMNMYEKGSGTLN